MRLINKQKENGNCFSGIIIILGILLLAISWINELLDLPAVLFNAEKTPFNYMESVIETIISSGIITYFFIKLKIFEKKSKILTGKYILCASCKSIKHDGKWVELEKFISSDSNVIFSHGICEKCIKILYPDMVETMPPEVN